MAAGLQGCGFVEEVAGPGDDLVAADLVVAAGLLGAAFFGDGVGAVQRIVERTPAGVGGVEGEAGVEDRHDELRARVEVISVSTPAVSTWKGAGTGTR